MRALFNRLRHGGVSPLEAELFAHRAEPSKELTDAVVELVRPRRAASRPSRFRLGYAAALTAALVGLLAATGGLAYAAQQITHSTAPKAHVSSACSQYAKSPKISKISPTKGKAGKVTVTIKGSNFSGNSKVTSVKFGGGKAAKFSVKNNTTITAKVPKGAKSGGITVTNCAGSATSKKFTVTK